MPGFSNFDPFMTGTYLNKSIHSTVGLDQDHYERAMRPLVREAIWREENFYGSDGLPSEGCDKPGCSASSRTPPAPSPAIALTTGPLGNVSKAATDFKEFVMPGGQVDVYRTGVVLGVIALSAALIGIIWQRK